MVQFLTWPACRYVGRGESRFQAGNLVRAFSIVAGAMTSQVLHEWPEEIGQKISPLGDPPELPRAVAA